MSEQGPYPQQPGAAPPPPPMPMPSPPQPGPAAAPAPLPPPAGGHAPAPPGAPTPVYMQPGASPAPTTPRKKRSVWVIVGIAVLLLLCLPALCIGGIGLWGAGSAKTTQAVEQAETHYGAAIAVIEKANGELEALDAEKISGQELEKATVAVTSELRTARAAIEPLESSQGRTDYLASLDEATKAIDGLENLMVAIVNVAQISERIEAAAAEYSAGLVLFNAIHEEMPALGMNRIAKYCALSRQYADVVIQMADDGKAGRVSKYNAGIDKVNAIEKKALADFGITE